jgi:hypothetical protein
MMNLKEIKVKLWGKCTMADFKILDNYDTAVPRQHDPM